MAMLNEQLIKLQLMTLLVVHMLLLKFLSGTDQEKESENFLLLTWLVRSVPKTHSQIIDKDVWKVLKLTRVY